jgi:hypothetical protein
MWCQNLYYTFSADCKCRHRMQGSVCGTEGMWRCVQIVCLLREIGKERGICLNSVSLNSEFIVSRDIRRSSSVFNQRPSTSLLYIQNSIPHPSFVTHLIQSTVVPQALHTSFWPFPATLRALKSFPPHRLQDNASPSLSSSSSSGDPSSELSLLTTLPSRSIGGLSAGSSLPGSRAGLVSFFQAATFQN